MTQSSDSTKQLRWADRGHQLYLHYVSPDTLFNTLVAKVYYQSGEFCASIKHIPSEVSQSTVEFEITWAKDYLANRIKDEVVKRLDNALQGET